MALLDIENLHVSVGGKEILKGITLALDAGQVHAIMGPNGSGKSTLSYVIAGRPGYEVTEGDIRFDGRSIAGLEPDVEGHIRINQQTWQSPNVFVPAHQRRVGFVFQHSALLPHLSVEQNLRYGWQRVGGTAAEFVQCVEQLDLAPLLQRAIGQLSGGERQRVALCRALINQPLLLLADEPTGNLDQVTAESVGKLLLELNQELQTLLIVVTHSLDLAGKFPRRVELKQGALVDQK